MIDTDPTNVIKKKQKSKTISPILPWNEYLDIG